MSTAARQFKDLGVGLGSRLRRRDASSRLQQGPSFPSVANAETPAESGDYVGHATRLFHDGDQHPPHIQQQGDGGFSVSATEFDGGYLSLVAELDADGAAQIAIGMDLLVHLDIATPQPRTAYVRAHFSNEEGREVLHDLIVVASGFREVRFNLDGLRIPIDLATTAWVDLVFADPKDVRLDVRAVSLMIQEQ